MFKILVPTDFSKSSKTASHYAHALANKLSDSQLTFAFNSDEARVVDPSEPGYSTQQESDTFWLKNIDAHLIQLNLSEAHGTVLHGKVHKSIIEKANALSADLIVMGSNGRSSLGNLFMGSISKKVTRHSEVPVIVVKQLQREPTFEKVAFVSDFSAEAMIAFKKIEHLLRALNPTLHLLNVHTPNYFSPNPYHIQKEMSLISESYEDCHEHRINAWDVDDGIKKLLTEEMIDLVIVATHGANSWGNLFWGSIAEAVMQEIDVPVMTVLLEEAEN